LAGQVVEAMAEADALQRGAGHLKGIAAAGQFQWRGNILDGGEARPQVKGLEDEADPAETQAGAAILVERDEILTEER
jgi:hypothetical protein